jgi:hypothetical protein
VRVGVRDWDSMSAIFRVLVMGFAPVIVVY